MVLDPVSMMTAMAAVPTAMKAFWGGLILTQLAGVATNFYNQCKQRKTISEDRTKNFGQQRSQQQGNHTQQAQLALDNFHRQQQLAEENSRRQQQLALDNFHRQQQLAEENSRWQVEMMKIGQTITQQNQESAKMLDVWPLLNFPTHILQYARAFGDAPPLTVLIAPPRWPALPPERRPELATRLSETLRGFLQRHFPFTSHSQRPVRFVGGSWKPTGPTEEAAVDALFYWLKGHPTLVLDTQVDGDRLVFRTGCWGLDQPVPYYGTFAVLPLAGLQGQQLEPVGQTLAAYHCLVAAAMADLYFLWQHDVSPQLPHLLPGLVEDVADPSFLTMVETMVAGYQQAYAHLAEARPLWEAELILEFAQSLAALPQKQYARQQMERSMRTWLAVRQLAPGAPHDLYVQVISNLRPPDQQYLQALQRCRTVLRTEGEPPDALEAVP